MCPPVWFDRSRNSACVGQLPRRPRRLAWRRRIRRSVLTRWRSTDSCCSCTGSYGLARHIPLVVFWKMKSFRTSSATFAPHRATAPATGRVVRSAAFWTGRLPRSRARSEPSSVAGRLVRHHHVAADRRAPRPPSRVIAHEPPTSPCARGSLEMQPPLGRTFRLRIAARVYSHRPGGHPSRRSAVRRDRASCGTCFRRCSSADPRRRTCPASPGFSSGLRPERPGPVASTSALRFLTRSCRTASCAVCSRRAADRPGGLRRDPDSSSRAGHPTSASPTLKTASLPSPDPSSLARVARAQVP